MKISSMRTSEQSTAVCRSWPRGQTASAALCLIGLLGTAVACSGNVDTQPTSDTQSSRPAATPSGGIGASPAANSSGGLAPATTPSGSASTGSSEQAANVGGISGAASSGGGARGGGGRARPRQNLQDAGADAAVDAGAVDAGADAAAIDAGAIDAGAIDNADAGG